MSEFEYFYKAQGLPFPLPAWEEANQVLHYFRSTEGFPAGSFTEHLIQTMARADSINLAKLTAVFPDLGRAVYLAQYDPEGIAILREIAKRKVSESQ